MGVMEGKVAIVTGGTRGIGRAASVLLAREGAKVIATGRNEAAGAETERQIEAAGGEGAFVRADVTSADDWQCVTAEARKRYGGLDAVINNAGAFWLKPIAETTDDDFDQIYRINVEGTWLGIKYGFQEIAATRRGGAIVNVSSLMGQVGFPEGVAYCATKGAVTGMSKTAALEGAALDPRIRVNSLHPGVIWTEMLTDNMGEAEEVKAAFATETPLRSVGLPEQIADAILFLASDQSSYVTGAELTIDGGRGAD